MEFLRKCYQFSERPYHWLKQWQCKKYEIVHWCPDLARPNLEKSIRLFKKCAFCLIIYNDLKVIWIVLQYSCWNLIAIVMELRGGWGGSALMQGLMLLSWEWVSQPGDGLLMKVKFSRVLSVSCACSFALLPYYDTAWKPSPETSTTLLDFPDSRAMSQINLL